MMLPITDRRYRVNSVAEAGYRKWEIFKEEEPWLVVGFDDDECDEDWGDAAEVLCQALNYAFYLCGGDLGDSIDGHAAEGLEEVRSEERLRVLAEVKQIAMEKGAWFLEKRIAELEEAG